MLCHTPWLCRLQLAVDACVIVPVGRRHESGASDDKMSSLIGFTIINIIKSTECTMIKTGPTFAHSRRLSAQTNAPSVSRPTFGIGSEFPGLVL